MTRSVSPSSTTPAPSCCSVSSLPLTKDAQWLLPAIGHSQWGHFLPDETTAVSLLDRLLHHSIVVVTDGESFRMREARQRGGAQAQDSLSTHGVGTFSWPKLATRTWPLTSCAPSGARAIMPSQITEVEQEYSVLVGSVGRRSPRPSRAE